MVFGQSGCIRAKVVVLGQNWLYSAREVVIWKKRCIRTKSVVFERKWLYSGKIGSIHARLLYSG